MRKKTAITVAITALLTGLAVKLFGDFAWNFIASLCAAVVLIALDRLDAKS